VENEDYMTAKKIKIEIDKIKQTVLDINVEKDFLRKQSVHTSELQRHISQRTAEIE
jgi:hypothetical protein